MNSFLEETGVTINSDSVSRFGDLPGGRSSLMRNGDANSAIQAPDVFLLTSWIGAHAHTRGYRLLCWMNACIRPRFQP